jgi:hypothetical protein
MESDNRNQQTVDESKDAKLTVHRKPERAFDTPVLPIIRQVLKNWQIVSRVW